MIKLELVVELANDDDESSSRRKDILVEQEEFCFNLLNFLLTSGVFSSLLEEDVDDSDDFT